MSCRNREREEVPISVPNLKVAISSKDRSTCLVVASNVQSFGFFIQDFLPRLATLTVLAVLVTLANEFRLTEC